MGGHETGISIQFKNFLTLYFSKIYIYFFPFRICATLARRLWSEYSTSGVDAVVFIVDSVDRERFPEAKKELDVMHYDFIEMKLLVTYKNK